MPFRNAPVKFLSANDRLAKRPVFFVRFGALGDATINPPIPEEFSSGAIQNETISRKKLLKSISSSASSIQPISGQSSIGEITFELIDEEGVITQLITNYRFKNRLCTLFGGYADIDEADFVPIYTGIVTNVLENKVGAYRFVVSDLMRITKEEVFVAATKLKTGMSAGASSMTVFNASLFAPSTSSFGGGNYLRVDDEIIAYTSVSQNADGSWTFSGLSRAQFGTRRVNHDPDVDVVNFIKLEGNPIDIALKILLTKNGDGSNGAYDVLHPSQGAGVDQSLVDVAGIEKQRDIFIPTFQFRFFVEEKIEAKRWLEENIFTPINAYPIVKPDGKLSIKLYTVPLPTFGIPVLDDSNVLEPPAFDGNYRTGQSFVNEVIVSTEFDNIAEKFLRQFFFEDSTSQVGFDEVASVEIEAKGAQSDLRDDIVAKRIFNNLIFRFSKPAPVFSLKTFYQNQLIGVGDSVILNASSVPNLVRGRRGGASTICEVISRSVNFENGSVDLQLLATEFNADRKYGAISPANFPDFTVATDDQKKYAFIGAEVSSCKVARMSDGTDGYYITP